MILSMTGYGRKTFSLNGKNIVLELKTLNSKTFDINLRLSPLFKEYEIEIRNVLNKTIIRGKTDCTLGFELTDDKKKAFLNYPVTVRDFRDIDERIIKEIFTFLYFFLALIAASKNGK